MAEFSNGVVLHGHFHENAIVLDEDHSFEEGEPLVITVHRPKPKTGTKEALMSFFGQVEPPPEFDPNKITREDLYD